MCRATRSSVSLLGFEGKLRLEGVRERNSNRRRAPSNPNGEVAVFGIFRTKAWLRQSPQRSEVFESSVWRSVGAAQGIRLIFLAVSIEEETSGTLGEEEEDEGEKGVEEARRLRSRSVGMSSAAGFSFSSSFWSWTRPRPQGSRRWWVGTPTVIKLPQLVKLLTYEA